jgi:hypothetical protein
MWDRRFRLSIYPGEISGVNPEPDAVSNLVRE